MIDVDSFLFFKGRGRKGEIEGGDRAKKEQKGRELLSHNLLKI